MQWLLNFTCNPEARATIVLSKNDHKTQGRFFYEKAVGTNNNKSYSLPPFYIKGSLMHDKQTRNTALVLQEAENTSTKYFFKVVVDPRLTECPSFNHRQSEKMFGLALLWKSLSIYLVDT